MNYVTLYYLSLPTNRFLVVARLSCICYTYKQWYSPPVETCLEADFCPPDSCLCLEPPLLRLTLLSYNVNTASLLRYAFGFSLEFKVLTLAKCNKGSICWLVKSFCWLLVMSLNCCVRTTLSLSLRLRDGFVLVCGKHSYVT